MVSRHNKANSGKTTKAGSVKAKLPVPPKASVARMLRKTETLSFRLTVAEKESIRAAASSYGMAITEYLVKCHEVISSQPRGR
jgi:hypothetical protein